jgi:tetratricopeptide (TPR) repeat protein
MKFEFSYENYQWCGQCGGNVRRGVDWCRYCHKKIGSRFLRDERIIHPSTIIDAAAHWLPDFNGVVGKCAQPFQERLHQADVDLACELNEEEEKLLQEKEERRTTTACNEFPPQPQAAGLVWDIMLSVHGEGGSVEDICRDARLALIGITPDTLNSEGTSRRREAEAGNACQYCSEFNLKDIDECRFCGSGGQLPPRKVEQVIVFRRLDPDLLTDVFLWEAGFAKINGSQLPAELLEKQGITDEAIEREAERHRRGESAFPLSVWRAKQKRLGVATERPLPDFAVEDLLSLASGCSWERRHEEATIVYEHAMRRVDDCENKLLAKTRILTGLATVAMNRNDQEMYQKYNNEANELRRAGMPAALRKMSEGSEKDGAGKEARKGESDHLRKVREANAQLAEQAAEPAEVSKVLVHLNKKMSNMMGNTIELAKLRLDADVAREAGELDRAATLIELGLSRLRNNVSDVLKQLELLGMLAHIQKLQGSLDVSESTHKHAISICEELAELGDGQEHPVLEHVNFRYGAFLMEQERYEEAEDHFQRALDGDKRHEERLPETLRFRGPYISEVEATIKAELSKLYRATDRIADAERTEAELASIQRQMSEQNFKTTGSLRKFTSS